VRADSEGILKPVTSSSDEIQTQETDSICSRNSVVLMHMPSEREYVLGTHDEEIARLGLQHRAWRPRVFSAWQSAGIRPSQTILDVGSGPGYASLDLAETVGPQGHVVAIDKSERFLKTLESACRGNVTAHRADLEAGEFPQIRAHGVWCRWVLCFVSNPREVLANMAASLEPGGVIVLHEYFDYATWRAAPPCTELEEFVSAVMASWRGTGGEPDIALQLPHWLEELGFELRHVRPIVDVVEADSMLWAWLRTFMQFGRQRLTDLGYLDPSHSDRIWEAFTAFEATPRSRMFTPGVLEIIAKR
jgi:SAM-dependent methyltransferase